jgi:hypothetical protein
LPDVRIDGQGGAFHQEAAAGGNRGRMRRPVRDARAARTTMSLRPCTPNRCHAQTRSRSANSATSAAGPAPRSSGSHCRAGACHGQPGRHRQPGVKAG